MITLTREEAQQVLAVLDDLSPQHGRPDDVEESIETLRARLSAPECVCGEPNTAGVHRQDGPCYEHPEPELMVSDKEWRPPAWLQPNGDCVKVGYGYTSVVMADNPRDIGWIPLYPMREWQGLTDEEILAFVVHKEDRSLLRFARAIEKASREKNA
jgi:hypothetical protein